jgi:LPS O-antigen subunit length determinant protein (WzzB/FepE family)
MQRLEMAKVNEARDTSTFQILDRPSLPTVKSRPNRRGAVVNGLVIGLIAGLAWAFGRSYLRSLVEPGPPKGTA